MGKREDKRPPIRHLNMEKRGHLSSPKVEQCCMRATKLYLWDRAMARLVLTPAMVDSGTLPNPCQFIGCCIHFCGKVIRPPALSNAPRGNMHCDSSTSIIGGLLSEVTARSLKLGFLVSP